MDWKSFLKFLGIFIAIIATFFFMLGAIRYYTVGKGFFGTETIVNSTCKGPLCVVDDIFFYSIGQGDLVKNNTSHN